MPAGVFSTIAARAKKILHIGTLKNKLIISYISIVAVSTIVIGVGAYNKASKSLELAAEQHIAQSLLQISDSLDSYTREMNRIAFTLNGNQNVVNILDKKGITSDIEHIREYKTVQDIIYSTIEYDYYVTGCTIFSLDGRNFSMNSKSVKLGYDFKQESWIDELKSKKNCYIPSHHQSFLLPPVGQKVVSMVRQFKEPERAGNIGYVVIDYSTGFMENLIQNKIATKSSNIFIMDQDNKIVYTKQDKDYDIAQITADTFVKHDKLDKVMTIKTEMTGEKIILSYYKSSDNRWTVVQTVPLNEVYQSIRDIRIFTARIIAFSLLFTVVISYFLAFSISRPIRLLRKNMKKVEQGNFDISANTDSTDEIIQLQNSFYSMAKKIEEMIEKNYKVELLRKEAELMAIQSQINPHFLCNTLSIIDSMAVIKGNNEVSDMCQALNKIFRYNIDSRAYSTIGQELEQIELYLYIQAVRYDNRLDYSINVEENLSCCKIMKLLIHPIVENVVIHVLEKRKGPCRLDIKVSLDNKGDLEICISDNGQGMSVEKLQEIEEELKCSSDIYSNAVGKNGYHIGLKNVHYRIKQKYGSQYGIEIKSIQSLGTTVVMVIPFIS